MTTNNFSILAYELINDKYSKAKYLGIECIMETKTGYINATKFCIEAQNPEKKEAQKEEDEKKAQETQGKKAEDGKKAKKRFDNYLRLERYNNLFKYMSSAPQFRGAEITKKYEGGNPELRGTYVHPDLLLDLASWISPAAYVKASGIVKNFLVREKEEENMRLKGDKSRLEKMFEESDKRREESDKRAEQDRLERKEAEKRAEQLLLQMTHQNEKLTHQNEKITHQNEKTHVELDETKKTLEQITHQNEKTHVELDETKKTLEHTNIKLDKTKISLQRVEARVEILVEEVVPPAKKVSLHEQFGIMKLNDSEGKREYKVYCVQTRGVSKARASIMKEYPSAVLIKEVNPNANAKNFLHKLKEKYGKGKNAKICVSYNFVNLKGCGEEELVKMIDEVVGEAKNFGV